jgi:hypothetical protein
MGVPLSTCTNTSPAQLHTFSTASVPPLSLRPALPALQYTPDPTSECTVRVAMVAETAVLATGTCSREPLWHSDSILC